MMPWWMQHGFLAPLVYEDRRQTRVSFLLHQVLCVTLGAALLIVLTFGIVLDAPKSTQLSGISLVVLGLGFVLSRLRLLSAAVALTCLYLLVLSSYGIYTGEGIHDVAMILFPINLLIGSLLLTRWLYALYASANVGMVAFTGLSEAKGWIIPEYVETFRLADIALASVLLLLTALLIRLLTRSLLLSLDRAEESENALRESEGRYRAIFNSTSDALFIQDEEGQILDFNDQVCRIYETNREAVEGKKVNDFSLGEPPYSEAEAVRNVRRAVEEGPQIFEWRSRRNNGELFWTEVALRAAEIGGARRIIAAVRDISERKVAEERVRASEMRFRSIVNATPMGLHMYEYQNDGRLVFVDSNPAADQILGIDHSSLIGKTIEEAFPHLAETEVPARYREAARRGIPWHIDPFVYSDANVQGAFDVYAFQTEPGKMVAMFSDISERRRTQEALAQREADLSKAQQIAEIGSYTRDLRTGKAHWSDQLLVILGISDEEPSLDVLLSRIHPEDKAEFMGRKREAEAQQGTFEHEYRIVRPDGTVRYLHDLAEIIRDEDGKPLSIIGTAQDITDRKLAENAVVERDAYLLAIFDTMQTCLVVVDPETGIIADANHEACRLIGLERDEILGEASERFLGDLLAGRNHGSENVERELTRADGARVAILRSVATVRLRGTKHLLACFVDISAQKAAEEENARLEERYRQAQKMEAIGQLTGGVAHDFNNLLQVINGGTEMARQDLGREHPVAEQLADVARAGERAARLVAQLLAFSRRQVMRPELLDLNEVVEECLKLLRRVIGEHVDLQWHAGQGVGVIYADRGMVEQVLMNLCVNARDAMPEGGVLTIGTEPVEIGQQLLHEHPEGDAGRYVCLRVGDTGCGMEASTLDRVFEPFFTTKQPGHGTGLGLAMVYGIISQHNGFVEVQSEVGKGTVFRLYWPTCSEPVEKRSRPGEHARVDGGTETILLAEDDDMVRTFAKAVLERSGYTVMTATNGREAVAKLEQHGGLIDLAILDVVMPEMGGREASDRMLQIHPGLRVLFASGYSGESLHTNFVLDEGLSLLQKPFTVESLRRAVRETLNGPADGARHRE